MLQEFEVVIVVQLCKGYFCDLDVIVEVDCYCLIYVMGEVGQLGQYVYVLGMIVQNVIVVVGGFLFCVLQLSVDIMCKLNGWVLIGCVVIIDVILVGDMIYVCECLF